MAAVTATSSCDVPGHWSFLIARLVSVSDVPEIQRLALAVNVSKVSWCDGSWHFSCQQRINKKRHSPALRSLTQKQGGYEVRTSTFSGLDHKPAAKRRPIVCVCVCVCVCVWIIGPYSQIGPSFIICQSNQTSETLKAFGTMKNELTFARSPYNREAYRHIRRSIRRPANRQSFSICCPATTYVRRLLGTNRPPVGGVTHVQAIWGRISALRTARFRP
jgi:hypothetical protein